MIKDSTMTRLPLCGIYLVLAAVSIISSFGGSDGAVPVTKLCRSASCHDRDCQNTTCVYGNCSPEGACICSACYSGTSCDKLVNNYHPTFDKSRDSIIVSSLLSAGDHVTRMAATDLDTTLTCHYDNDNCPCSQMLYSIESGNDDGLFAIDNESGDVTVTQDVASSKSSVRKLHLSVVNRAVEGVSGDLVGPKDFATLTVGIGSSSRDGVMETNSVDDSDRPHDRQRRAAATYVSNITFSLIKTGVYNYTTTMYVGSKIHFQLQITFPVGTTDLDVELFTPDNATTVMVICSPQITMQGKNIKYTNTGLKPVLSSLDGSYNYDWAVLDFGNVTNDGTDTATISDVQMFIEWDVVMLDTAINGTQYWVSAGAQYNSQNEIWIGQAGFNSIIDNYNASSITPSFNISGPSTANVGQTLLFHVDMYLPNPVTDVAFEAFAPVNFTDSVSLCNAMVVSAGDNYACLPIEQISYNLYPSVTAMTNERATLNLGHLINAGSREVTPFADSVISVEFMVYIPVNATWVGQTVWIGAAVALGTDQIWAGEIGFTVTNTSIADVVIAPALTLNSSVSGSINIPILLEYNMTIPNYTDTTYTVSINAPGHKVCSIDFGFLGVNIPCLNSVTPPVYTPSDSTQQAVWNLGRIRNGGQRSLALDPTANTMQFIIYVLPTASAGTVTVTLKYGSQTPITKSSTVSLVTAAALSNSSSPITTMYFNSGNGIIPVNASTDIRINIATYPGAVYTPVYLEITVPYGNSSNIYSICRVEVVSVGKYLPCVNMTALNESVEYYQMSNYSGAYKAVLQLDSVCNANLLSANNMSYTPSVSDSILLSVIVRIENAVSLATNGSVNWVGAGLTYTPGILWLGSESVTTMQYPYLNYKFNQTPFVSFSNPMQTNWTVAPAGSMSSFIVTIKLPPQSVADWSISASVTDTTLSVCNVYVKAFGHGIPCLNYSTPMIPTYRAGGQGCSRASLNLYKLSNVGTYPLYKDPIFDSNTLIVEVLVMVSIGATIGSTKAVTVTADRGMDGIDNSSTLWFNVGTPAPLTFSNLQVPTVSMYLTPVNENDSVSNNNVFKGETVILTTDITIPTGSQQKLNFTLTAPSGSVVDIVAMNVVLVGINIPCIARNMFSSNLTSYPGSYTRDVASMDLGTVCSWPVDTSLPVNDILRVEAVVTVVRNSSSSLPIILRGLLNVNGTDVSTTTLQLNVISTVDAVEYPNVWTMSMADVRFNMSNTTIVTMYPADMFTLNVDLITAPNSSVFSLVDVKLPVDSYSASMTVVSVTVVSFGLNIGSFEDAALDFPTVTNSTYGSTQMDRAYINFGKIINTGHSYRTDKYQYGDDNIRIQIVMQMADALVNTQNSYHTVSVGARLGLPMIYRNLQVQTIRSLTEAPLLNINPVLNSTSTTPSLVNINVLLSHTNLSRAEAYNASLFMYLSNYAVFSSVSTNYSGPYPNVTNMTANDGVSITFSRIYFTDIIQLTIQLLVLPAKGNYSQVLTFASLETLFTIIYRPSAAKPNGFVFQTPLTNVNYTVTPVFQAACMGVSVALGMQSKAILDCQLSSSISPISGKQAVDARFGSGSGWVSGSHNGPYERYYQVNFGNLTIVSSIQLASVASYSDVTQYQLRYSNDGINWINGETVTTSVNIRYTLLSPVESVYLRVYILAPAMNTGNAAFTVEFYGCVTGIMPSAPNAQCAVRQGYQKTTATLGTAATFTPRNFIVTSSNVFFCDTTLAGTMACFRSTDLTPSAWQAVDDRVANVLGYLSTTTPGQLFGIDSSQRVIVVSEDAGLTWMSLSPQRYTAAALVAPNVAIPVPWQYGGSSSLVSGSTVAPSFTFPYGSWGANFDGILKGSTLAADWNSCCP